MRRFATAGALMAIGLAATGCVTLAPPPPSPEPGDYRVGPPDTLLVTVLPEPRIERLVVVRPDGMISLDLIGDVLAIDRTVDEIARDVEELVKRFKRDPVASVALQAAQSPQVTVFGEVNSPGTFPLQRQTRVSEAIGLRGGPTIFASKSRIRVVRVEGGHSLVYHVDLKAIKNGDQRTNMVLTAQDIVVVPPNMLARVGYALQTVLFPFQQVLTAGSSAAFVATGMSGGRR